MASVLGRRDSSNSSVSDGEMCIADTVVRTPAPLPAFPAWIELAETLKLAEDYLRGIPIVPYQIQSEDMVLDGEQLDQCVNPTITFGEQSGPNSCYLDLT